MNELAEFSMRNTVEVPRGSVDPYHIHAENVGFYGVLPAFEEAAMDAKRQEFLTLVGFQNGEDPEGINPFDGKEHDSREIEQWLGHRPATFRFMGLAKLFGMCTLVTPAQAFPEGQMSADTERELVRWHGNVKMKAIPRPAREDADIRYG